MKKRDEKGEKRQSTKAQICSETTVIPVHNEMHPKAPSGICFSPPPECLTSIAVHHVDANATRI